jgi:GT2 family glycosyltransferase
MGSAPVAVVIPSWNCIGDLRPCIEAVRAQSGVGPELFVVDNGSDDGTVPFLERERVPHVALSGNIGFSAAVNLGVSRTRAAFVTVLNADTVLEPDCLERLVASLSADPTLGGVQPRILQLERGVRRDRADPEAILYSLGQALTRDGRGRERDAGRHQGTVTAQRREVFGVCGAACVLRRELLESLGGYDERYFAFCEDVDLNVRARIAGWRFYLEPEAVVWHVGNVAWSAGFRRPQAENARLVARNRLATQIKFMPAGSIPRIALVEAGALARAAAERRLGSTLAGKLEALRWLPDLLRARRRLRDTGELGRAREWLGATESRPRLDPPARPRPPSPPAGRGWRSSRS